MANEISAAQVIAKSLDRIARGGVDGPEGIEGLAMALMTGIKGEPGVAGALNNIASALDNIAEAIRETKSDR